MVQPRCEKHGLGKKDFQLQKAGVTRGRSHSLRNLETRQRWSVRTGSLCQTALASRTDSDQGLFGHGTE